MRAIVTEVFIDKFTGVPYNIGDVVDFDEERIGDLVSRDLVKIDEQPKEKAEKPKRARKTKV